MQLDSLAQLDAQQTEAVLSAAMARLLPDPGIETARHVTPDIETQAEQVVTEVFRQLNLPADRPTVEDKSRALDSLRELLVNATTTPARRKRARERLIEFDASLANIQSVDATDAFEKQAGSRGVTVQQARETVLRSDRREFMLPRVSESRGSTYISIFMRWYSGREGVRYAVLVEGEYGGGHVTMATAFRVYASDVDVVGAKQPLDVLMRFVHKYGLDFKVPDGSVGRFFLHLAGQDLPQIPELVDPPSSVNAQYHRVMRQTLFGMPEAALVFVVNLDEYYRDLRRHGVEVRPSRMN